MLHKLLLLVFLLGAVRAQTITVTKTAYEKFDCSIDFSQVMGTDAMSLASVTAAVESSGTDATSTVIATSPVPAIIPSTYQVSYRVQNGQPNVKYRISVKVTDTTNGAQWEGVMMLQITQPGGDELAWHRGPKSAAPTRAVQPSSSPADALTIARIASSASTLSTIGSGADSGSISWRYTQFARSRNAAVEQSLRR